MRKPSPSTTILFFFAMIFAILTSQAPAPAAPGKASLAVMGMYTTIRFPRGALDDFVPEEWPLDFFSKERVGMHMLLQGLFTTLLSEEVEDLDIVPPAGFERLELNIRRKTFNSFQPDAALRFNWPEVQTYCKLLSLRYALFGDVTKLDIDTKKNTLNFDMIIYIYDTTTQLVVFTQAFSNNGQFAEKIGYNSLRRLHRGASPEILNFMRTNLGRAALIVYDAFIQKLGSGEGLQIKTGDAGRNTTADGSGDIAAGGIGSDIEGGANIPDEPDPPEGYASAFPCNGGDSLVLSAPGAIALLDCERDVFTVRKIDETTFPAREQPLWPTLGEFDIRGAAMLSLSPTNRRDTDAIIYPALGDFFALDAPAYTIRNSFGEDTAGAYSAAGDIDGDGRQELILAAGAGNNEIAIYKMSGGNARLIESIASPFGSYEGGLSAASGDFNGDGTDEIALSRLEGGSDVRIFKRNNNRFDITRALALLKDIFPNYSAGSFIAAGDFDGDKIDELAVAKVLGGDLLIYKLIKGKFTISGEFPGALGGYRGGIALAAGDFDADKIDELVLTTATGRDEAYIFKFTDGNLENLDRMAKITGVFSAPKEGLFPAAGTFRPVFKK